MTTPKRSKVYRVQFAFITGQQRGEAVRISAVAFKDRKKAWGEWLGLYQSALMLAKRKRSACRELF